MTNSINDFLKAKDLARKTKALEQASKIFDKNDNFNVHGIEAIFAIESSFGTARNMGVRGSAKPAGYFQQKKDSAIEDGLIVTRNNDERFDLDLASIGAAKRLKRLDKLFSKKSSLGGGIFTVKIDSLPEREIVAVAAYNIGQGRVAQAQVKALEDGKKPITWEIIKDYLILAGATKQNDEEVKKYVEKYDEFKKEFSKKSKVRDLKDKDLKNEEGGDCHWVTINHGPICIPDKKSKK